MAPRSSGSCCLPCAPQRTRRSIIGVVRVGADDNAGSAAAGSEDLISSSPDRLDTLVELVNSRLARSFNRTAMLIVAALASLVGFVVGQLTAAPPSVGPAVIGAGEASPQHRERIESLDNQVGRGLLTLADLATIGEPAARGTYTLGSASVLPDGCSGPTLDDVGVRHLPGPEGATSVSFQLAGGSVTERVTTLSDDGAARQRLQVVVTRARDCPVGKAADVEVGLIGPGVGDEYVHAVVIRSYPSGGSSTVTVFLVRVGAVLLEFSLAEPTEPTAAADSRARCLAIVQAGLRR